MYDYLEGILQETDPIRAVVDIQGIGYKLSIPPNVHGKLCLSLQQKVKLFVSYIVREDAHLLYGFLEKEQRTLFETIINVSGIGPKIGLALIGHLDLPNFHHAIANGNSTQIQKVPGIGKKTAERLIMELKDKMPHLHASTQLTTIEDSMVVDAIAALTNLGYGPLKAQATVQKIMQNNPPKHVSALITEALQAIR
jgi:Holliday junction DNA helicase RuvA